MSRRRTHDEAVRSKLITIRVTDAQHARLKLQAATQGTTLSGLTERLVTKGRVVMINQGGNGLDRDTLHELKRIGNNLNQIAHAVNGALPPDPHLVATNLNGLVKILLRHHYFAARSTEAVAWSNANDSSAPQARDEFQRNAQLRSSRP